MFHTQTALSCQDEAGIASLWCLRSQWREESGKHSSLSRLCLWVSPGRELAWGCAAPGAWWASQRSQRRLPDSAFTSMLFLLKMWRAGKAGPLLAALLLPTNPEIPSQGHIQQDGNRGTGGTAKGILWQCHLLVKMSPCLWSVLIVGDVHGLR